jgi:hypothetical protein
VQRKGGMRSGKNRQKTRGKRPGDIRQGDAYPVYLILNSFHENTGPLIIGNKSIGIVVFFFVYLPMEYCET